MRGNGILAKADAEFTQLAEGNIYLLPLEAGGYAVGLIARIDKRQISIMTYFFKAILKEKLFSQALDVIEKREILDVTVSGTQTLKSGDWPVIGTLSNFKREEWPVPVFKNRLGFCWEYDQDIFLKEVAVYFDPQAARTFRAVSYGVDALAYTISKMLGQDRSKDQKTTH